MIAILSLSWLIAAAVAWALAMAATCGLSVGFELARRRSSVLPAQRAWAARQRIVLLRPLHGVTPYLDDCLESLWLAASNAGASIRLAAECAGQLQPAAESQLEAVLVALRERYPRVRAELVRGKGPAGSNRKVANLVQGLDQASFDVLVLSDADMDVPPDYVTSVVGPLRDPVVGLTTCPYRSVPVRSLVSRIDALLTNTRFLPNTCMAVSKEALHFALGSTIAVRKDALESAGGLERLLDEPADDYMLARNVEDAGYSLRWVPLLLDHRLAQEPAWRAAHRQLRWMRAIRRSRRSGYAGLILTHGLVPACLLSFGCAGQAAHWPWALPLWWLWQAMFSALRSRVLGLSAGDYLLLPVADLAAFLLYAGGWFGKAQPPD